MANSVSKQSRSFPSAKKQSAFVGMHFPGLLPLGKCSRQKRTGDDNRKWGWNIAAVAESWGRFSCSFLFTWRWIASEKGKRQCRKYWSRLEKRSNSLYCHLFFSSVWCLLMPLATCERSFQWVCTRDFVFKNAICILANEQRISQQKVINELLKDQTKRASSKKKHMELMNTSSGGYSCFMRDRIASWVPVFLRGIRVRSCRPKAETAEQNCRISMTVRNWFLLIAVLITSEGTWHSKGANESRCAHF